jgi:hypothetical protein
MLTRVKAVAAPDDTTIPGEDFVDMSAPAPRLTTPAELRLQSDAPDRLVFFFSGFDPRGATFYHRLFRSGIAQRNAAHDETMAIGKRHRIGRWASVWTSLWRGAPKGLGQRPETMRTRMHFMRWDDIVRRHWRRAPLTLARDYWNIYARGLASGVLARLWRTSPPAFWLALLPLAVGVASLALGTLVVGGLLALGTPMSAMAASGTGLAASLLLWRVAARWVDCEWMLRLVAFMREHAVGEVPIMDVRLDEMADRLVEAVEARMRHPGAAPLREVMVMGYSSGTILAASVLARALPRLTERIGGRRADKETSLSLVTLGQCLPIATSWPQAHRLRGELEILAECAMLTWHDYSSSSDRAAFWKSPPWPSAGKMKVHQASPPFKAAPGGLRFAALSRERRDMHLQYLRPPAGKGDASTFDVLAIAGGPQTLAERHAKARTASDLRG